MDCHIGPYSYRKIDGVLKPKQLKVGREVLAACDTSPFPNVVLEVAFRNEDQHKWIQELLELMSPWTSVQVSIGIKIENKRSRVDAGHVLMTAYVYNRPQPNTQTTVFSEDENTTVSCRSNCLFWNRR